MGFEIDFLPVGNEKPGNAIALRFGNLHGLPGGPSLWLTTAFRIPARGSSIPQPSYAEVDD